MHYCLKLSYTYFHLCIMCIGFSSMATQPTTTLTITVSTPISEDAWTMGVATALQKANGNALGAAVCSGVLSTG